MAKADVQEVCANQRGFKAALLSAAEGAVCHLYGRVRGQAGTMKREAGYMGAFGWVAALLGIQPFLQQMLADRPIY